MQDLVSLGQSSTSPMADTLLIPQQHPSFMSWTVKNTTFFKSQYKLLPRHIQESAKGVFDILFENPYHPSLMTHALRRPLSSYHGISITEDYRIIARIIPSRREIILHDIGTHDIYRSFGG